MNNIQFYQQQIELIKALENMGFSYFDFNDNTRGRKYSKDGIEIVLPKCLGCYTCEISFTQREINKDFLTFSRNINFTDITEFKFDIISFINTAQIIKNLYE